jgi:hypothetical protein
MLPAAAALSMRSGYESLRRSPLILTGWQTHGDFSRFGSPGFRRQVRPGWPRKAMKDKEIGMTTPADRKLAAIQRFFTAYAAHEPAAIATITDGRMDEVRESASRRSRTTAMRLSRRRAWPGRSRKGGS